MKTCKDCIYYLMDKDRSYTTDAEGYCHLHPIPTATYDEHWCGQLKEKVHVISDFETDMEQVSYATKALSGKPND